jgi:NAD(P)H-flavin reductase/ferredoxin
MAVVVFENKSIQTQDNESVLDALLRDGHDVPYGCKNGVCQSCVMTLESGDVPSDAQKGLTDQQKKVGSFLACSCFPSSDIAVAKGKSDEKIEGEIKEISSLSNNVIKLKLTSSLSYFPGQFVNLWRDDQIVRSYSLASVPDLDDGLEFHIRHVENGQFSDWIKQSAKEKDAIKIQGPLGTCFYSYSEENKDQPMLLAGIGTGLAPLYGIVRDALNQGHSGQIVLIVGAKESSNLYLLKELKDLSQTFPNFAVEFVAQQSNEADIKEGDIYQEVKDMGSLKGYKVYICGADSFVNKMKKQCFLSGANMPDIQADSFVHSS